MDFALTATQADVKATARRFLADRFPDTRIAEIADSCGTDPEVWPELRKLGWLDADLPQVDLTLLAEEAGRALLPSPWLCTAALAVPVYAAAGLELPGPIALADGSASCHAVERGGAWRLDGQVHAVWDARTAARLVVAARTPDGVALFEVEPTIPEVSLAERAGIDPLRAYSELRLYHAAGQPFVAAPDAEPLLAAAHRRATALLAAESVGVADHALEAATQHARDRVQFGKPIGSFQAVSHQLAENYADLELARSLAYRAACALDDQQGDEDEALATAAQAGRDAAIRVCETAIQVCGGIGATWEFPLHRWYRRALWIDAYHAARLDPLRVLGDLLLP